MGQMISMFVGVTEFVKCPKEVIPSFVWLERAQEVDNFLAEIFASPFYSFLKLNGIGCEGERGESTATSGLERVNGLVQGVAQVLNCVNSNALQRNWHGLSELDLMHFLRSVRIDLNDLSVWVTLDERSEVPFKVTHDALPVQNCTLNYEKDRPSYLES